MEENTPEDLTALTPEELDARWLALQAERQRRAQLDAIPVKILDEARKYIAGGGDPAKLPALPESVA